MTNMTRPKTSEVKTVIPKAVKKGNFKDTLGIDVEVYVLDNPEHQVVLSQRGLAASLGLGEGGGAFPRFLRSKYMSSYVGEDTLDKLNNPLIFRALGAGQNDKNVAYGFDISLLADACDAIIDAYANNEPRISLEMYQVARSFDKAAKKTGWKSLGWAVAGYNPQAQEVIDTFKKYLVDEMELARKWLKTFPDELYLAWADVYGVPAMVGKNHHVLMRWLTTKHIYKPLLRSNGKIFELLKERRAQDPKGKNKRLFQYLNELLGEPALQKQIMQVMTIAQLSQGNKDKYESDFNKLFGEQLQFDWDKLKND